MRITTEYPDITIRLEDFDDVLSVVSNDPSFQKYLRESLTTYLERVLLK